MIAHHLQFSLLCSFERHSRIEASHRRPQSRLSGRQERVRGRGRAYHGQEDTPAVAFVDTSKPRPGSANTHESKRALEKSWTMRDCRPVRNIHQKGGINAMSRSLCCLNKSSFIRLRAYLRTSVGSADGGARGGIPEADMAICCTSATGKEVRLMWAPINSLYSCSMVVKCEGWCDRSLFPDHQLVVIAAACQLSSVTTPFQSAHLLQEYRLILCNISQHM